LRTPKRSRSAERRSAPKGRARSAPKGRAIDNLVAVATRGGPHAVDRRTLARRAEKMLVELGLEGVELSIALVDDDHIAELNRRYRNQRGPTDVLSFSLDEGDPSPGSSERRVLGDVVISVPTARRQAVRQRRGLRDEVTMLLAHGLLHLLGYDHQTDAEDRRMRALTQRLELAASRR
jgi:probable rRNA maturation factor